ncbi:MAG: DUF4097 family beta strand repeat-containing protein [Oscillospiraceae bacterium]
MAINLHKEAYPDRQGQTEKNAPIREVFPTYNDTPCMNGTVGEDGEIYPVREIHPTAPPQVNIHTAEETTVEKPAENPIAAPRKKRIRKRTAVLCAAVGMVILGAVTVFGLTYNDNSSKYSCYRTAWQNIYSSEGIGEVIIKGDKADLTVEYGEAGCDIEFGTITGNEAVMTKIPEDSESSSILIDFTCIEIEGAYCAKDPDDVTLTLPGDYKGSVKLIGSETQIYYSGAVNAGKADFYCQSGDIILDCVTADNITLMTGSGNIKVSNSRTGKLEAVTSGGAVTLSNVTANKGAAVSTDYGSIHLDDTQFIGGTDITTIGGYIYGSSAGFEGKTVIGAVNSYISFRNASFGDMYITNENGDILISSEDKRSDYTISAETANGECDTDLGGSGANILDIKNINGDIHVYFDE